MSPSQPASLGSGSSSFSSRMPQTSTNDPPAYVDSSTPGSSNDDRRPSAGSYFGRTISESSLSASSPSVVRSPSHLQEDLERQQRPFYANSNSYGNSSSNNNNNGGNGGSNASSIRNHPLDAPAASLSSSHSGNSRRKHPKEGESGLLSFFRSSSRPPSPDLLDTFYSNNHARKASFSGHGPPHSSSNNHGTRNSPAATAAGSLGTHISGNGSPALSYSSTSQLQQHHNGSYVSSLDQGRRRSVETYSRTPSPDRQAEQHQQPRQYPQQGTRRALPTTPPPQQTRPHQRTDSIKSAMEAQHRRTKSTDFGDMYGKHRGSDHEPPSHVTSPAKQPKMSLLNLFKKKTHHGSSHPSQQQQQLLQQQQQQILLQQQMQQQHSLLQQYQTNTDRSRKCSADDQYPVPPPQPTSYQHQFSMTLFPDHDNLSQYQGGYDRRQGSDVSETQRTLQYIAGGKKNSRKDSPADALIPPFVMDLGDMTGIKNDPKQSPWLPLSPAGGGSETWLAPESWGVQPPAAVAPGLPRSLAMTPEDVTSEEMDQSDYENWDYGKKKVSTIRIFRADTTYTTVNCVPNITASELNAILSKKTFKPDPSKYHLYMLRNSIVRQLGPRERPLKILTKYLLQFGYTDQDKLEELSGKDNSFLCRFTFAEIGAPLTTEADFPEYTNYAEVNLQKRCLPTVPIFLYSRAKDIVRLNISHNQRMDLPLDFVQNCSVLRELRMAYNDLDRVPSNVRFIAHLQVLDLRGNRIKDLEKACLEDARELSILFLQSNLLESIPESFQSFEHLRILNLSSNNLAKVPMTLFRILSLEELDLSFNEITEVPDEIGQLSRLQRLSLFGNRIGPYLPTSMEKLVRLRMLDIRQNGILNLDSVNDLPSLEELLVDYNTNVILNNSFKSLVRLSVLKCSMADINLRSTGDSLSYLDVSSNKLSNLPSTLFDHLRNLDTLKLDNNSISSIPATIGQLKRLRYLSIANNLLSTLPEEIGLMDALIELDIHSNSLNELPVAIWRCSLVSLNVSSNLLDAFPDPPKNWLSGPSDSPLATSSSASTLCEFDISQGSPAVSVTPSLPRSKPLPAPPVPLLSLPSSRVPFTPPLSLSLLSLFLGDNRLPDEVLYPLSSFKNLRVLNLSHNYITEIPRGKIPNPGHIVELYLSGNQLTSLPAEDIERLRNLRVLHVNGNKLTTLPAELGKINRLGVLDVGCNTLKYNISNWPYDWNWNWNLELKYLNMSGNKRLQIKRQTGDTVPTSASRPGNLSEFGNLTRLRILGLMDVTITDNVPEDSVDRRVRTSMSTLHNMSYGMADTLGVGENLCIWDLVHPKFQTKEDESLFGLFDGRSDRYRASSYMTSHLKDRFGSCLKIELEKLEGADTVVSALRRTFLGLDRELWSLAQEDDGRGGASALVAYVKGTTLYSANVGDAIAVLVKKSDSYHVISQKHIPWNPTEASRIKRSGGFVSEKGLLNGELDISRSFGQYNLVPVVNSNPYIDTTTLSEDDDFLIMASSAFWDVMSYNTAVDIAKSAKRDYNQDLMFASHKLRDIAISYGAKGHMVVMLIGVGDLFTKKEESSESSEYHQQNFKRPKAPEGPVDALRYLKPEIEPPQGDVAMVFTDIKNSTKLWENHQTGMALAIKEHFNIMRRQLRLIGGYEVKNEGDALMASFSSVPAAMLWCFKVQELLVIADWPQDILDSMECKATYAKSDPTQPMYRGLSVRMGIHWGRPVSERDAVTRRMDYYGPMVNRAARICDSADGGEIFMSSDAYSEMHHLLSDPDIEQTDSPHAEHVRELKKQGFGVIELGEKKLKGLETPDNLHLIYPSLLAGRLTMNPLKVIPGTPVLESLVENTVALDPASVRALQMICLRLERLASGTTAQFGRAPDQNLMLLSLPIKDNADQEDLSRVAENMISRIENCFSQLYMSKSGHFVEVFESLGRAIDTDPSYILRALQMYVSIMGGLDSPSLL